ncbi:MAG TPA: hypothetical protein VFP59_19870 [Candidatus Angelobacter sp.]|nr:hypothetical protein [Candidatus Angelobacter sp.]
MIHIDEQTEPAKFNARVRIRGRRFIDQNPDPTPKQWRTHQYWREIGSELHDAYGGICAYSCHWIPYDTGADTVEHFRPKDRYPADAYEWSNYRLVCATLNGRKGIYEDVLDPFALQNGWFTLDFPSMLVKPNGALKPQERQAVQVTIDRLGLNDESTCLKSRAKWLKDYCDNHISLEYLRKHAPFIVAELERQSILDRIREIFAP